MRRFFCYNKKRMQDLRTNFAAGSALPWQPYLVGAAALEYEAAHVRLLTRDASRRRYTNAQLDDASDLPRGRYRWQPPLRMMIRARFSHPADTLRGTAGFGFWNYPLALRGQPSATLPQAVWFFFASPPSNIKLDQHAPGYGWKAATIDTLRPAALRLIPLAPLAMAAMNIPPLYRQLWPPIQQAVGVCEQPLAVEMTDWHIYALEWLPDRVRFTVDGQMVLEDAPAPGGPLCFVLWLDNQYAIVTPWGRFGWGLVDMPGDQWIAVDWLAIERTS
jgi:hypothetical protein